MPRDNKLYSGFMTHDYILTFSIEDPATGTVRLRGQIADVDEMALDTRSTRTVRVGPGA